MEMQVVVFGAHDAPRERLALSYTSRRDPPESGPKQTGPLMLTVFHRTTKDAAAKILRDGFRDTTSRYLTDREWSGVWVSDRPLDNSEGASGEALLQIDIAEDLLTAFEWVEEGEPFREWLVPAAVLNDAGTVRLLDESAD
jgi:hypothetical protein